MNQCTFYLIIVISLMYSCSNGNREINSGKPADKVEDTIRTHVEKPKTVEFELKSDSGYIFKTEAVQLLLDLKATDTSESTWWYMAKTNDTLGKYYLSAESGNYIICLLDLDNKYDFETHYLIELKPEQINKYSIIAEERYFHGNYACCWKSNYEGFNKLGPYFYIKTCGTGSGYCSSMTRFFKRVLPQDKIGFIDTYQYSAHEMGESHCKSKIFLKAEKICVLYHYTSHGLDDDGKIINRNEEDILVKYKFTDEKLVPMDSSLVKKYR